MFLMDQISVSQKVMQVYTIIRFHLNLKSTLKKHLNPKSNFCK